MTHLGSLGYPHNGTTGAQPLLAAAPGPPYWYGYGGGVRHDGPYGPQPLRAFSIFPTLVEPPTPVSGLSGQTGGINIF